MKKASNWILKRFIYLNFDCDFFHQKWKCPGSKQTDGRKTGLCGLKLHNWPFSSLFCARDPSFCMFTYHKVQNKPYLAPCKRKLSGLSVKMCTVHIYELHTRGSRSSNRTTVPNALVNLSLYSWAKFGKYCQTAPNWLKRTLDKDITSRAGHLRYFSEKAKRLLSNDYLISSDVSKVDRVHKNSFNL